MPGIDFFPKSPHLHQQPIHTQSKLLMLHRFEKHNQLYTQRETTRNWTISNMIWSFLGQEKVKSYWKLSSFSLFAIVCTTCCVFQIYETSKVYFAYETVVDVNVEILERNEFPAITICTQTYYILHRMKLFLKYPWIKAEVDKVSKLNKSEQQYLDETSEVINNIMYRDLYERNSAKNYSQMILDAASIVKKCEYLPASSNSMVDCAQVSNVTVSFNWYKTCFTLLQQHSRNIQQQDSYIYGRHNKQDDGNIVNVTIDVNYGNRSDTRKGRVFMDLYLHSHDTTPHIEQESHIRTYKSLKYDINFSRITTQLLPSPYDTKCMNYTKMGYKSRDDCIYKCQAEIIEKLCNGIQRNILVSEHSNHSFPSVDCINKHYSQIRNFTKKCFQILLDFLIDRDFNLFLNPFNHQFLA